MTEVIRKEANTKMNGIRAKLKRGNHDKAPLAGSTIKSIRIARINMGYKLFIVN